MHIKNIDLYGYQSMEQAFEQVKKGLSTVRIHKFIPDCGSQSTCPKI